MAIKRFDVRGARGWKDVELAEREARVLSTLDHPLVPTYIEHFEEEGSLYLVMEKVEGETMEAMRQRYGTLSEAEVRRFLASADSALTYLHGRASPVVHRDIKPRNVVRRPDGSYVLVDFGAVAELPDGLPPAMGRLLRIAMAGDASTVADGLRAEGFIRPGVEVDAQLVLDYLSPFVEPARHERFHFDRGWMRTHFGRLKDVRRPDYTIGLKLNLPPSYLLIHRVWLGCVAVLCQLDATVPMRAELRRWIPEFGSP